MELIPKGYQRTEVGVIPEDWEVKALGEIMKFQNGVNADKAAYGKGVPFINVLEPIKYSRILESNISGRINLPQKSIDHFSIRNGDVVFNRTSETLDEVALAAVYEGEANVVFGGFVIRGRQIGNSLHPIFASSILRTAAVRTQIISLGQGVFRANIGQADLKKILVPIPQISEQTAIATALSDVDALIGSLEALIAKQQALKAGAMQELLSGKRRLQFEDSGGEPNQSKWDSIKIGELFAFKNGLNKGREFFGFGTPIINYMDVYGHDGLNANDIKGKVSVTPEEVKNFGVRKGDVFFTRTSETVEEIGIASVLLENIENGVFSGFLLRARPTSDRIVDEFKKYCFSTINVRRQITNKSSYTTRALTNGRLLSQVEIEIPPSREEQSAIAQVLTDMDSALAALEAKLRKVRALKAGMMAELLTGRVRLV